MCCAAVALHCWFVFLCGRPPLGKSKVERRSSQPRRPVHLADLLLSTAQLRVRKHQRAAGVLDAAVQRGARRVGPNTRT
eukprot:COSAG06_NODE_55032_length_291_cov_1.348958_1_plen_78_part_10